jgi:hypothetical protein
METTNAPARERALRIKRRKPTPILRPRSYRLQRIITDPALREQIRRKPHSMAQAAAMRQILELETRYDILPSALAAARRPIKAAWVKGDLIRDILLTGDLIGFSGHSDSQAPWCDARIVPGSAFMLVALSPRAFRMLVHYGAELADLEDDDAGGGNVEDKGEPSLGWPADPLATDSGLGQGEEEPSLGWCNTGDQEHLADGVDHRDLEDEHDGLEREEGVL